MMVLIENQFLPPISSFIHIAGHNHVKLEAQESYQKRSYRNRSYILASSGYQLISLPLRKGKNQQQAIQEVELAYDQPWEQKITRQLQSAYGKSAFYDYYIDDFNELFFSKEKYLFDLNKKLWQAIMKILQWDIQWSQTDAYKADYGPEVCDLRDVFSPLGERGKNWPVALKYPQVFEDKLGFVSDLCILDLIFNVGPEAGVILEQYKMECPPNKY